MEAVNRRPLPQDIIDELVARMTPSAPKGDATPFVKPSLAPPPERQCPNPRCRQPLPSELAITPLFEGSVGYGYRLPCCGIVCTTELLRDYTGLDLPDADSVVSGMRP